MKRNCTSNSKRLLWIWRAQHRRYFLPHSVRNISKEPRELSQWLCYDDSSINKTLSFILILYLIARRYCGSCTYRARMVGENNQSGGNCRHPN